ncbi:MAG: FAD-binding and (Fe-S)-binding domain-containing protein [Thermoplasmatota archaeon]
MIDSKTIVELEGIVGRDSVRSDELERLAYSRDMSVHRGVPDVIVFPHSTDEVSRIMVVAHRERVPVTPRGSGTSVTGGVLPLKGGIVLDLCAMNRIKEIKPEDRLAVVEPGVICADLNAALAPKGLFFPPDPGSSAIATLGGMAATNASGLRAVKYGTMRDFVMGLEVVLADGRVIRTGTRAPKSSSGYDLTRLLVCSEGTLGVITELTLRVLPAPEHTVAVVAAFKRIEDAGLAISRILGAGVPLACAEVMDRISLSVVKEAMRLSLPDCDAMLLMELDGDRATVEGQLKRVLAICGELEPVELRSTDDPSERLAMWTGRSGLVPSFSRYRPGSRLIPIAEDFGVPPSRIPEAIKEIQEISRRNAVTIATFGHVGDGNLHSTFIIDVRSGGDWEKIRRVGTELIELAVRLGGTVTAEHATGRSKAPFIRRELGEAVEVMASIKRALDPEGILNPGKMGLFERDADVYDHFAFEQVLGRPEELQSFGEEVDNELLACIQCGFCRGGCPVFARTRMESYNAKGFVTLAFGLYDGSLRPSRELVDKFYHCTTCMNCRAKCPAGIKIPSIVQAVRTRLSAGGLTPGPFLEMVRSIVEKGNAYGENPAKRAELLPERLHHPREGAEALVFMGCLPSLKEVRIVPAMLKLLDRAGVSYTSLGVEESCCGLPAYLAGAPEAPSIFRRNVERLERLRPGVLVSPCAGCVRAFRELYPKHTGLRIPVMHIVEYLHKLVGEGRIRFTKKLERTVAYHDPCDIGRHLGIYEPPREILKAVPGIRLVEFRENRALAKCCGGGGGLKAYDAGMSLEIAERRVLAAAEVGADTIVSACPTCRSNLSQAAARVGREGGGRLQVLDIVELLARAD